jgi:holliday junction DNA helicase RuvA
MIGKLKGTIDSYGEDHVILDVAGVGYVVFCSSRTLQALAPAGEAAVLAIETQVREDSIKLFGFRTDQERDWFRLLQSVQGVGAKVALGIMSAMTGGELATAISTGDKAMIARAPGVGPKLAQRIAIELKDKAPAFGAIAPGLAALSGALEDNRLPPAVSDAVSALTNLGYGQAQAQAAINAALKIVPDGSTTSVLIRQGLKELAK